MLPFTYTPTYPHDHHAPPASQTTPLTAPWHPALSAISPPLAPSHHAASTDHRLPPPRLINTTAGKCFHSSARALSYSWQPIPRSEPAATYLCVCNASLLHQHRRMSLEAREVQRRQRVRANCGHPAGASAMKGPATRGGHSSLRLPGGDSACRACRDDDANQLGIRQHRLASQRRRAASQVRAAQPCD